MIAKPFICKLQKESANKTGTWAEVRVLSKELRVWLISISRISASVALHRVEDDEVNKEYEGDDEEDDDDENEDDDVKEDVEGEEEQEEGDGSEEEEEGEKEEGDKKEGEEEEGLLWVEWMF